MPNIICGHCGGKMFRELYEQPCGRCKQNGASHCMRDWVWIEYTCINCARQKQLPRMRKHDLQTVDETGGANVLPS